VPARASRSPGEHAGMQPPDSVGRRGGSGGQLPVIVATRVTSTPLYVFIWNVT
jgi:hypothetical protein